MNKDKILIIDIETTGFRSPDQIVEVGIVSLDIDTGEKEILFDKIFKPRGFTQREIENTWIVQNSSLTTSEIFNAEFINDSLNQIQEIMLMHIGITAFNNAFDFKHLERLGIRIPQKLKCPMRVLRPIIKVKGKNGQVKNPSFQEAWNYFKGDTGYVELHRGADDAFHEADIVYELIKLGKF